MVKTYFVSDSDVKLITFIFYIIVYQSLGSRPTQVLELFTHAPHLLETTSRCLFIQPLELLPSRNI